MVMVVIEVEVVVPVVSATARCATPTESKVIAIEVSRMLFIFDGIERRMILGLKLPASPVQTFPQFLQLPALVPTVRPASNPAKAR